MITCKTYLIVNTAPSMRQHNFQLCNSIYEQLNSLTVINYYALRT